MNMQAFYRRLFMKPSRQHSNVHQILLCSLQQGVASTICSSR